MTTAPGLRGVQRWLVHQGEAVRLELVCAEHPGPETGPRDRTVVRLAGCAREIDPTELVELLALGADRLTIRLDGCAESDAATGHLTPIAEMLRAGDVDLLRVEGATGGDRLPVDDDEAPPPRERRLARAARRRPVLDAAAMPVSRRQLFGLPGSTEAELPPSSAGPHERLVAAVRAVVTRTPALEALPGPALTLSAHGCTACGVCVLACPADALEVRHGAAGEHLAISTLLQVPAACDGCRRCVDLCPTHVLTAGSAWPWSAVLTDAEAGVATVTTASCARCSTSFPVTSGERYCSVCAYRRANPFGSTLPPGFVLPAARASAG